MGRCSLPGVPRSPLMSGEVGSLARRSPSRPQQRGDRRRDELLAAVERALARRPLSALSIAEIARAAGTTRSTFYFYFANKQAAVFALLQDIFFRQSVEATAILQRDGDRLDNLAAALGQTVHGWRAHRSLMLAALEARATDPEASASWDGWIDLYVAFLAGFIRDERTSGHAPAGPDEELLARVLIAANERMLERHLRADQDEAAAIELHSALVHVWAKAIYYTPTKKV